MSPVGAGSRREGVGRRAAARGLRFLIALVLLATAVGKLLDVPGFARVLGSYRAFPEALLTPIAILVPAAELLLAAWLFSERRPFGAALTALVMHVIYAGWAASAILRGLVLENCGCFGVFLKRRLSWSTVAEDLVMTGLCGLLAILSAPKDRT